ncbi:MULTISPECIES: DUF72 domain-containing protein [Pseudomonadaceae]|uniref:DUF72 domain-containing protein n=1 Tax=Stutzerimonas stutzeri TaxID=316 RepID=A0A0D9AI58_STUST|nr:DUF72 domain-containing protein [Stutzerimonas stutzeri]KJH80422.1 hypothetical protein UF78_15185 [Stutzerimonas stutzeri]
MNLPYFLGCPSWNDAAWRGALYSPGLPATEFLARYCAVFNSVEGNTTLYAWPSVAKIERWAALMPDDFRFCAKLPREISQATDLRETTDLILSFRSLLAPLGQRVSPFWLQLPATFGPARLGELVPLIETLNRPLAVEVRHPAFFARGEEERALNRLLHECGVERVCMDTRALFSCRTSDPAVLHAQSKKPRLPVRPAAFSQSPQLRFVGHPELAANDRFLAPWLDKVAGWIEAGKRPHVYLHTPDNRLAPDLAMRFHEQLSGRLPGLPPLAVAPTQSESQMSLLDSEPCS